MDPIKPTRRSLMAGGAALAALGSAGQAAPDPVGAAGECLGIGIVQDARRPGLQRELGDAGAHRPGAGDADPPCGARTARAGRGLHGVQPYAAATRIPATTAWPLQQAVRRWCRRVRRAPTAPS